MPANADVNVINDKITDGTITKEKLAFEITGNMVQLYDSGTSVPDFFTITRDDSSVTISINSPRDNFTNFADIQKAFINRHLFICLTYRTSVGSVVSHQTYSTITAYQGGQVIDIVSNFTVYASIPTNFTDFHGLQIYSF